MNGDTKLLAWGGFLNVTDQKGNKENRWILTINYNSKEIVIVQHEQQHAVYPFDAVLCVFENLKYENAVMIFWKNAKPPIQFFFDSSSDRDSVQKILESIPKNNVQHAATAVGAVADFAKSCEKKGKMKWAKRYLCLIKSRILIFRDNTKNSKFPLQMISLLEPNIQIKKSEQYGCTVDIYAQEKHIFLKLSSVNEVKEFIDKMSRTRERMTHEANAYAKLKMLQASESKRSMMQKSMVARQDYVSRREISQRNFNPNADNAQSVQKIMLANGSTMSFKGLDAESMADLGAGGSNQLRRKGKRIKFDKAFKPNKHKSDIFMFGKARPPRLFPKHSASQQPFRHDALSQKRFVFVTTAKDGTHCMGFTDNDWTFVWGEANFTGALGLGAKVKSTLPYLIKPLRKQNVIQVSCSARHGIAVTVTSKAFGWGAKTLTNLDYDSQEPQPLPFLDNLGILAVDCSATHSVAYSTLNKDVYSFGMKGPWLGNDDMNKTFGKVNFDKYINDPSNKIFLQKVCVANQYTMYLFSNGRVYTTGVNEHGRMGCTRDVSESQKPIQVPVPDAIGEISTAAFHSGFVSFKGRLYTCGVGADYRLGHGNENTYYEPTMVQNLSDVKCARVECVEDRTFVISKYGAVLMFGIEPVTRQCYRTPFIFEFLRTHRVYQICGAKDFTVALGVQAKEQVQRPNVPEEASNHLNMGGNYNDYTNTAANTLNQTNALGNGHKVNSVINSNFVQSSGPPPGPPRPPGGGGGGLPSLNSGATGPPPFVPLDVNPGFGAKPLPDVVPVKGPYGGGGGGGNNSNIANNRPNQLPNPFANPNFGGNNFGGNNFGGNNFGGNNFGAQPGPPPPPNFGGNNNNKPPPFGGNNFGPPPFQNNSGPPPFGANNFGPPPPPR